ncbi:hypothetical protein HAX54_002133, partial [Datura stramonium]|nr:hypothetical protein [Datura stramonium]
MMVSFAKDKWLILGAINWCSYRNPSNQIFRESLSISDSNFATMTNREGSEMGSPHLKPCFRLGKIMPT